MMRQYSNAAGAVALLCILFAASLPQVNGFFYQAIGNGMTAAQGEARDLKDPASSQASDLSSSIMTSASAEDSQRAGALSARGSREPDGDKSQTGPSATITTVPSTSPATAVPPAPSPTLVPPAPTPTTAPFPPVNPAPKHIALQAGHWKYKEAPAPLNTMTGSSGGGKTEPEITLAIANEVAKTLRSWGHTVDILPTNIPLGYKADLLIAIHTDGATNASARGFFTDRPEGSPVAGAEARLSAAVDSEYARATGIPYVNRSTQGSHYYYGYRQVHASVPMILIETGFLTNVLDQEILIKQPQKSVEGIANGIKKYLGQ